MPELCTYVSASRLETGTPWLFPAVSNLVVLSFGEPHLRHVLRMQGAQLQLPCLFATGVHVRNRCAHLAEIGVDCTTCRKSPIRSILDCVEGRSNVSLPSSSRSWMTEKNILICEYIRIITRRTRIQVRRIGFRLKRLNL